MTVFTEITRIKTAIADAYTACQEMGATMPAVLNSDNLEQCIASITGGGGSATVLHLYDRVDNKATVAGFWTDGDGHRYAVCVVDAAYRSGHQTWSNVTVDTLLPNHNSSTDALVAGESGTWNTDTILNNYTPTDYPAFNIARNALTITVDNKNFVSCLPNAAELQMIYTDRTALDTYDTTLTEYPNNSLSSWNIGGNSSSYCLASVEYLYSLTWFLYSSGSWSYGEKNDYYCGIIPVIEIPVDENGEVQ